MVQIIIQITQKSCLILVIKELKARFFSYDNTDHNRVTVDSHQKYLLPRVEIENYNIEIDGRNFYDQPIIDLIKKYDDVRKVFI